METTESKECAACDDGIVVDRRFMFSVDDDCTDRVTPIAARWSNSHGMWHGIDAGGYLWMLRMGQCSHACYVEPPSVPPLPSPPPESK